MAKKQVIKLTEGDLHRIIKESVERIINEAQLNELDPRTYASYAQKRAAQGNQTKAEVGRQAAVNSFNKQFSYDDRFSNNGLNQRRYHLYGGKNSDVPYEAETYYAEDTPEHMHGQTIKYGANGDIDVQHRNGMMGANYKEYNDDTIYHPYDAIGRKQTRISKEMAKGNGKYIKGQGWQ